MRSSVFFLHRNGRVGAIAYSLPQPFERVQLVQRALQLGFSLKELSEILRTRDNGGVPCHRVLHLTEEKLRSLGQHIEELQASPSIHAKTRSRLAKEAQVHAIR